MSYYDSMAARSILEKATYVSVDKIFVSISRWSSGSF